MDLFDSLLARSLHIRKFESFCGGLPAPHCVGVPNPLNYKFSWSPRGVLVATNNGARYLEDGKVVDVGAGTLTQGPSQRLRSDCCLSCKPF